MVAINPAAGTSADVFMVRYAADVVVLATDDAGGLRVLLVRRRRAPHAGLWALPGGRVDHGETARQAAVRELAEEAGVRVTPGDLVEVGVYDEPGRDPRGRYVSVAYVYWGVLTTQSVELVAGDDASHADWVPVTGLNPGLLAFDHHAILIDAVLVTCPRALLQATQAERDEAVREAQRREHDILDVIDERDRAQAQLAELGAMETPPGGGVR